LIKRVLEECTGICVSSFDVVMEEREREDEREGEQKDRQTNRQGQRQRNSRTRNKDNQGERDV